MDNDPREYVKACVVCNQHKHSRQAPVRLLQPLPIPRCPWSNISVDFVTGLPCSNGNTVILTIVDKFSKMAHFVRLPKLSSAKEMAQLLVQYVFRLHGLPVEVVGLSSPLAFGQFCKLLGATSSLMSGFHPQSNGQMDRKNQKNPGIPPYGPPF